MKENTTHINKQIWVAQLQESVSFLHEDIRALVCRFCNRHFTQVMSGPTHMASCSALGTTAFTESQRILDEECPVD